MYSANNLLLGIHIRNACFYQYFIIYIYSVWRCNANTLAILSLNVVMGYIRNCVTMVGLPLKMRAYYDSLFAATNHDEFSRFAL